MEINEFKKELLDSVNGSMIPNLSNSIKEAYAYKHTKWYKRPKFLRIAVPVLALYAVAAITIPVVSITSKSNITAVLAMPDDAYTISALTLGNVISFSDHEYNSGTNAPRFLAYNTLFNDYPGGNGSWDDMFNKDYNDEQKINQDNLKRAIFIINPFLYVGQKLLEENFAIEPDFFSHNHGWRSEEYNYSFSEKGDFTCKFEFKETVSKDKSLVNVNGTLNIDKSKFTVKGNRLNVSSKEDADISLRVGLPIKENCGLTFKEKQNDKDSTIYNFVYDEDGVNRYELDLCIKSKMMYATPMPVASFVLQNNFDDDHNSYEFTLAKGPANTIFITLNYNGREVLIEVRSQDSNFVYFLPDYTNDPFDNHGRH